MALDRLYKIDTADPSWGARLSDLVAKLTQTGKVHKVLVFGSLAMGQMSEGSDIDLLVVVDNSENPRHFRQRIPTPFSTWPTDLVVVTEARFNERKDFGGVIMEAVDFGIELYPTWNWRGNQ